MERRDGLEDGARVREPHCIKNRRCVVRVTRLLVPQSLTAPQPASPRAAVRPPRDPAACSPPCETRPPPPRASHPPYVPTRLSALRGFARTRATWPPPPPRRGHRRAVPAGSNPAAWSLCGHRRWEPRGSTR